MIVLRDNNKYEYKFNDYTDLIMNYFYTPSMFQDDLENRGIRIKKKDAIIAAYRKEVDERVELIDKISQDSKNKEFVCPLNGQYTIRVI